MPTETKVQCVFERMVPLLDLKPHPKNPNKHPAEQIRLMTKIIGHQGWRSCIVVSNRSGYIVEGHARAQAAAAMGLAEVPVDFQDFDTEADELAHLIDDNAISEFSGMNAVQLESLLKKLEEENIDAELAGILKEVEEEKGPEAEYPIAPRLQEHYDYVMVFTTNEMDFAFLQGVLCLESVQSYKKSGVGLGHVIPFSKFYEAITANRNSFREQAPVAQDHQTPAAG